MKLSKIGFIKYHIKRLNKFDEITKFRLLLLAYILIIIEIIMPVLGQLKHLLSIDKYQIEAATIIALFSMLATFGQKIVKYIQKTTSFSNIYRTLVVFDILWALSSLTYFINPVLMIWIDSILALIHGTFQIAFTQSLNNYITYFKNENYTNFQNYRNDIVSEFALIGTLLSIIISYLGGIEWNIIVFSISMLMFNMFQIRNWNIFEKYDFKYMLRYHKNLRNLK